MFIIHNLSLKNSFNFIDITAPSGISSQASYCLTRPLDFSSIHQWHSPSPINQPPWHLVLDCPLQCSFQAVYALWTQSCVPQEEQGLALIFRAICRSLHVSLVLFPVDKLVWGMKQRSPFMACLLLSEKSPHAIANLTWRNQTAWWYWFRMTQKWQ